MRDGTASEAVLRRRRLLAIGAVAVAIVIAIIVAVVAANGGSGGSAETTVATPVTPQTPVETPTDGATTTTSASSTAAEVTVPASGHLSAGDSGPAVETLQQALKQLGLYDGAVDGDFGQGTSDAVVAFQNAHNLTPDGIVGQATADAINQALAQSVG
jgi:peptidoglycan hydrolase-like protein with peptidoglycan-binding domain